MKRFVCVIAVASMGWLSGNLPAEESHTYYFQLIAGSNKDLASKPGAKPIGLKLRNDLETKFRWKNYMELSHGQCTLDQDETTSIKLPEKREIKLHLHGKGLHARLYRGGQLVRTTKENADARSLIMGGDQGRDESWFIVIRRDKPSTITAAVK